MRHIRFVPVLTVTAIIAACSAARDSAPPRPEPTTPVATNTPPPGIEQPTEQPRTLKAAMKGMEEHWQRIEKGLAADPVVDLKAMATAAQRVAAVMKLAYDPWEDKEVPNFGQLAREAEAAFLDLAAKAAAGDATAVKAMQKTLQPQHCARCHDAFEAVHG